MLGWVSVWVVTVGVMAVADNSGVNWGTSTQSEKRAPPPQWVALPDAVQKRYQKGVPHTDRNGRPLTTFDTATSFLPLIL
jgi:hypothetical protein